MSDHEFLRRRDLLTRRLVEQIKSYNSKLIMQCVSVVFFVLVVLPFTVGAGLYLLNIIFMNVLARTSTTNAFVNFKDVIISLLTTNRYVHLVIMIIAVAFIIAMVLYYLQVNISLSEGELALAGFILAKTTKNMVLTYQNLHKELEFRSLSYESFDKVSIALLRLEHIHIEDNPNKKLKVIIRDSNW